MVIPHLNQRIQSMIFRKKFDSELEEIRPELNTLRNAGQEVKKSAKLRRVLQVRRPSNFDEAMLTFCQAVLMVGNKLNASTFRGNATGFQLDALSKVR
jgi:diaphanous 1